MKSLQAELRPLLRYLAVFSFFMNMLFLVPAIFMSQVFDRVLTSYSQETLWVLLGGTLIALLLLLTLDYVRNLLQNVLGNIIEEHLAPRVVNTVVANLARSPQGARPEGLRDVNTLRNVFSANGLIALFDAPWVVIYVLFIGTFHASLGVCAGVAAAIMVALAWVNDRMTRAALESGQKESRRASQYMESSMRNAEVLQALGMTSNLLTRWRALQDRVVADQSDTTRTMVAFSAGTRFFRQLIQIVMLSLGAYLVLSGHASAGIMIATTILLGRAVQPVEQLVASWRSLTEARAAYRRLLDLSKEFPDDNATPVTLPCPDGQLMVDGVSLRAPGSERIVLNNVSFALSAGEALAVIGPSAAGKSSLARLLTGVWRPLAGVVRLDGADVAYWPREDLGQWIGYVPQDVELFEGTVAENIARLGTVDSEVVVAAAKRAFAHELILNLPQGYDTPVGEGGGCLSPGQRQRIALARALYRNPRLVLLDEPNANLDGAGELALAHAIRGLRKDGVTTIVITHRPSLIAHVDKILLLEGGRVAQFGPVAQVMKALQRKSQAMVDENKITDEPKMAATA